MSSLIALTKENIQEDKLLQEIIKDTPNSCNFYLDFSLYGGMSNSFVYTSSAKSEIDGIRYKYTFIGKKSSFSDDKGIMYVTQIFREV